jgi:molybdate transport system permease protein
MSPDPATAVWLSLRVGLWATLLSTPLAVGLGWVLAKREFPGKPVVSMAVLVPLVLPPVATGVLLLELLGRRSLVGGWLAQVGLPIAFTQAGAVVAAVVVGLPLYVMACRAAFEAVDTRLVETSWTCGRGRWRTFRTVTLPLALPGVAGGAVLCFARALGEFGATVVLAGNQEGSTRTISLAVYTLLDVPARGGQVGTLLWASLGLSAAALLGYELLVRWQKRRMEVLGGRG